MAAWLSLPAQIGRREGAFSSCRDEEEEEEDRRGSAMSASEDWPLRIPWESPIRIKQTSRMVGQEHERRTRREGEPLLCLVWDPKPQPQLKVPVQVSTYSLKVRCVSMPAASNLTSPSGGRRSPETPDGTMLEPSSFKVQQVSVVSTVDFEGLLDVLQVMKKGWRDLKNRVAELADKNANLEAQLASLASQKPTPVPVPVPMCTSTGRLARVSMGVPTPAIQQ